MESLVIGYPESPVIQKLVHGLISSREPGGYWSNTQENAWACYALYRYFQVFEKQKPNYVAKLWINDMFCGESNVKSFTTETVDFAIPMKYVQSTQQQSEGERTSQVILQKKGEGRLYYRLAINFAPTTLDIPSEDYGFTVQRTYYLAPAKHESNKTPVRVINESGVWKVKKGTQILVEIKVDVKHARYNVAVVDYLPGGFEIENPVLKISGNTSETSTAPLPTEPDGGCEEPKINLPPSSIWFEHVRTDKIWQIIFFLLTTFFSFSKAKSSRRKS